MTPVFSHGRLRLYLLKLLADGPRHGYELIRLLEKRFLGLYAPSAGTIYPRLQRLEAEGLVRHTAAGGRKTYEITEAGRDELRRRDAEVTDLESAIRDSVADLTDLAQDIRAEVGDSVRDLKRELRDAVSAARGAGRTWSAGRTRSAGGWAPDVRRPGAGPDDAGGPDGPDDPDGTDGTGDPDRAAADAAGRPARGCAAATDPAGELERKLNEFVAEAWALVNARHRVTETQARTAIRILDGTLDGLRRLLR
ncbi:PadR family transcriptional regulator [Plantactinospora sp. KBS50]|uniref:PadR family transcriptional regulator n=1 Tax=Plantactinospora sp. KBS50 TaxID=2024580 RepID=UPI0018E00C72|nr:PadR family transcriptional regulator [Plantactinospora sp. KBS50]